MPRSIAGVRRALSRERRDGERRIGLDDMRAFRMDRRTGERRRDAVATRGMIAGVISGAEVDEIDDDMIVEISDLDDDLIGGANEAGELTQIIELVAEPLA